ncbi:MAG TPA: glycosyltransferase family 2 protein [Methylotenera sp.]
MRLGVDWDVGGGLMKALKISVCMATYNGESHVIAQLVSILNQLGLDDEVVISDNGSSDETINLVRSLNDQRVKLFVFDKKSVVGNFENALKQAAGDVIFLADQDDIWLDGRVERMIDELRFFDLVVTNSKIVDDNLKILHYSLFDFVKPRVGFFANLYKNSYIGCCMAFNRKVLVKAIPFPEGLPMHDWWIGLVGGIVGSVKFIDEPFLLYRRHSNNVSETSNKSSRGFFDKARDRFYIFNRIVCRFIFGV